MHWQWPVGAALAFLLALLTTPAGVSGAVLLLPIQLSVLHVPSPSVTPTNLLFNVAATPGGLFLAPLLSKSIDFMRNRIRPDDHAPP